MKKINSFLTSAAIALVVACSFSSCKDDDSERIDESWARFSFVNTIEGSMEQDAYINDNKVGAQAVAYGSVVSNISTRPGNKTITFKNMGSSSITALGSVNAADKESYTVFLVKKLDGQLAISSHKDDYETTNGKAKVRFVNVAPLLGAAINVRNAGGTSLISNLGFNSSSSYQTMDANTALTVSLVGALEGSTISGAEFQAGKNYTVWFDSTNSTAIKYHIIAH